MALCLHSSRARVVVDGIFAKREVKGAFAAPAQSQLIKGELLDETPRLTCWWKPRCPNLRRHSVLVVATGAAGVH